MSRKTHIEVVLSHILELVDYAKNKEVVLLAGIFHDIGNSSCNVRKVVESEIERYSIGSEKREKLLKLQVEFRLEHQVKGAEKTRNILQDININEEVISKVTYLIMVHDLWKICPEYKYDKDGEVLVNADVLWMFSKEGLEADIERDIRNGHKPKSIKEQWHHNYKVAGHKITLDKAKEIFARYRQEILC